MGTLKTIRAFMYSGKSVPVKEKKRGRDKKRDSDTERAHDSPKRHANYGLSSPVSIPTLGESLAQVCAAQIAQIQRVYYLLFNCAWRCMWGTRGVLHKITQGQKSLTFFRYSMYHPPKKADFCP